MRAIFCRQCGIASFYPEWKMRKLGWRKRRGGGLFRLPSGAVVALAKRREGEWICPLCVEKEK